MNDQTLACLPTGARYSRNEAIDLAMRGNTEMICANGREFWSEYRKELESCVFPIDAPEYFPAGSTLDMGVNVIPREDELE